MGKIFIGNIRGPKGNKDDRGSNWKEGTAITGTSTTDTAFPDSGLTDAMVDDQYLNTDTGNLYTCTVAGDPNTAMWVYTGNIKGPKGDVEDGVIDFSESDDRENIVSGDTVSTVFGKIKKWFSDLGAAAFMNVVNGVTQSQAGQAVLDAAVGKYLEEKKLDITKIIANRNITEPGFIMNGKTVADALTELNGNVISTMGGRSLCIQTRMLFDTKYSDHFELLKGYWNELGDPSCFGSFVFVLTNFNTDRCFWICGIYGTRDFGIAIQFPRGSYSALSLRRYNNGVWETPTILS